MSRASEITQRCKKAKCKYDGMRTVQVTGQNLHKSTALTRRQIGRRPQEQRRKAMIARIEKRGKSGKPHRMSEELYQFIEGWRNIDSEEATAQVWTKLFQRQLLKVFTEHAKEGRKVLTRLRSQYNLKDDKAFGKIWRDREHPYWGHVRNYWRDLWVKLQKFKNLNKKHRIWFTMDLSSKPGGELFGSASAIGGVKDMKKRHQEMIGEIDIFMNELYSIAKFVETDAKNGFKDQMDWIENLIRHEMAHRLQTEPIMNPKTIIAKPNLIKKFRLWLLRKSGTWFKKGDTYLSQNVEISAYANEIAHSVKRNTQMWMDVLTEYNWYAPDKSRQKLVNEVYRLMKAAGMSDEEMLQIVNFAGKHPKQFKKDMLGKAA